MSGNAKTASANFVFVQPKMVGWLRRAGQAIVRAHRVYGTRAALRALPEATLKDIGISRSEIDSLAERLVDNGTGTRA
jgi:uncharacterized protein YjiS (DUF1127 family)